MNLNEVVIELIKSDYIKNCIRNTNHQFTYEEQLAIILNSTLDISVKRDMISEYLTVADELKKCDIDDIKHIIDEMGRILNYASGNCEEIVWIYRKYAVYCSKKLDKLIDKIRENITDDSVEIGIYNVNTVEEIGCIVVNSNNEIVEYSLEDSIDSELYNHFIEVPNDLHIGDVVTTDDISGKVIVVSNPMTSNKFKGNLTYSDASIVVIPINLLDKDKDYKEQIEKIYTERISNIDNPYAKPDIIMEYSCAVNILNIQK